MQDASSLASMNEQFGEQGDPCSAFNQLMGLLAGIYDGTLDFIDQAIGDITALLNDSGLTSLFQSIVAAVVGAGSVVADIISAIVGVGLAAFKTVLGILIPIVSKVINAVGDITSAIANEIAALADMAAELLRKALALVLGGAALDPCKKEVLMNTGTTAMKDAVTQLNQPLLKGPPHIVGTTTDSRADAEQVKREMKYSRDEAKLNPGVPQSPFADSSHKYVPQDADDENSSIYSQKYSSSYKIAGQNVTATEYKDNKAFSLGEMSKEEEEAFRATGFETPQKDGTTRKLPVTSPYFYEVTAKWIPKQKAYIQSQGDLYSHLYRILLVGIFETDEHKAIKIRLEALKEELGRNNRVVKHFFENMRAGSKNKNFRYYSKDGKVDKNKEEIIKHNWSVVGEPEMQRLYDSALTNLEETKIAWESMKDKIYEDPTRVEWYNQSGGSSQGVSTDSSDF